MLFEIEPQTTYMHTIALKVKNFKYTYTLEKMIREVANLSNI
jgi:hypothetical protein